MLIMDDLITYCLGEMKEAKMIYKTIIVFKSKSIVYETNNPNNSKIHLMKSIARCILVMNYGLVFTDFLQNLP